MTSTKGLLPDREISLRNTRLFQLHSNCVHMHIFNDKPKNISIFFYFILFCFLEGLKNFFFITD